MFHRDSSDDEDADLIALRQAALRTLPIGKRRLSRSSESDSFTSSDTHDKDYRFENRNPPVTTTTTTTTNHDIDERFPIDQDLLIVDCPNEDDEDLLLSSVHRKCEEKQEHRSVSKTIKFNSNDFDLRQLIKKRRVVEEKTNENIHLLPKEQRFCVENQRTRRRN